MIVFIDVNLVNWVSCLILVTIVSFFLEIVVLAGFPSFFRFLFIVLFIVFMIAVLVMILIAVFVDVVLIFSVVVWFLLSILLQLYFCLPDLLEQPIVKCNFVIDGVLDPADFSLVACNRLCAFGFSPLSPKL